MTINTILPLMSTITLALVSPLAADPYCFEVPLFEADSTFGQVNFGPDLTIDGVVDSANGWAVSPQTSQRQRIWWETDGMILGQGIGPDFEATLKFRGIDGSSQTHLINRFRIQVTTDAVVNDSSNWQSLSQAGATATGPSSLGISGGWVERSGSASRSSDYTVVGEFGFLLSGPVTGISVEVEPLNGKLGSADSGNFILTEFGFRLPLWDRAIVREEVGVFQAPGGLFGNSLLSTATAGSDMSFVNLEPGVTILDDSLTEGLEYAGFLIQWPDLVVGVYHVYLIDNDTALTGYEAYAAAHGLKGELADFEVDADGDGYANGMDYLFARNPNGRDSLASEDRLPSVQLDAVTGGPKFRMVVPRPAPNDVRLRLLEDETLSSFDTAAIRDGFGVGSLWAGAGASRVTMTSSPADYTIELDGAASSGKDFFQLEVEQISGGGGGGSN